MAHDRSRFPYQLLLFRLLRFFKLIFNIIDRVLILPLMSLQFFLCFSSDSTKNARPQLLHLTNPLSRYIRLAYSLKWSIYSAVQSSSFSSIIFRKCYSINGSSRRCHSSFFAYSLLNFSMHWGWWILRLVRPNSLPHIAPTLYYELTRQYSRFSKTAVVGSGSPICRATLPIARRRLRLDLAPRFVLLNSFRVEASLAHFTGRLRLSTKLRQCLFIIPAIIETLTG